MTYLVSSGTLNRHSITFPFHLCPTSMFQSVFCIFVSSNMCHLSYDVYLKVKRESFQNLFHAVSCMTVMHTDTHTYVNSS